MGYLPYLSTCDSALVIPSHFGFEDYSISGQESLGMSSRGAVVFTMHGIFYS